MCLSCSEYAKQTSKSHKRAFAFYQASHLKAHPASSERKQIFITTTDIYNVFFQDIFLIWWDCCKWTCFWHMLRNDFFLLTIFCLVKFNDNLNFQWKIVNLFYFFILFSRKSQSANTPLNLDPLPLSSFCLHFYYSFNF